MICITQGSVYQKTNAMSEIRKTNKDNFWAQAEVGNQFDIFSLLSKKSNDNTGKVSSNHISSTSDFLRIHLRCIDVCVRY